MKPIKLQTINEKFKVGTDEYEKLYEDDNFLLVIPLTHDASCKYQQQVSRLQHHMKKATVHSDAGCALDVRQRC